MFEKLFLGSLALVTFMWVGGIASLLYFLA